MSETTTQTVEEEIATLDREIESMERELSGEERPLVWGEVDADELARKEQRRGILPRLLQAARIKRLELRKRQYELEVEPLYAEREERHRKLERAKEKERKAKEEQEAALGAWNLTHSAIQGLEHRIKDVQRQIREGAWRWIGRSGSKPTGRSERNSWRGLRPTGAASRSRTSWGAGAARRAKPRPIRRVRMKARAKPCPVCSHLERSVVERGLAIGQSPRSIQRRYAGLTRKAIQRHRDKCLAMPAEDAA